MDALDVSGDGNVDVLGGGIGVAERDNGDVNVTALHDGLVIGTGVCHNQKSGLLVSSLDLISECTRGESAGDGSSSGVKSKLQDGSLK